VAVVAVEPEADIRPRMVLVVLAVAAMAIVMIPWCPHHRGPEIRILVVEVEGLRVLTGALEDLELFCLQLHQLQLLHILQVLLQLLFLLDMEENYYIKSPLPLILVKPLHLVRKRI
jgi:hypothetical protein